VGLTAVTALGYPKVNRKIAPNQAAAEKRFKEHTRNCGKPGEICPAKLWDVYDHKKLCLIHAVFSEDWLQYLREAPGFTILGPYEREMTTKDGMWKDDHRAELRSQGLTEEDLETATQMEAVRFNEAGGRKPEVEDSPYSL